MCSKPLQILSITKIPVSLFQGFVWVSARNPQRGIPENPFRMTASQSQEFLLMVCILSDKRDFSHHLCRHKVLAQGPGLWGQGQELALRVAVRSGWEVMSIWRDLQSLVNDNPLPLLSWSDLPKLYTELVFRLLPFSSPKFLKTQY